MNSDLTREVQDELARVLASAHFVRSPRSTQLLRFLVEHALAGQQDQLKEYTIATMALGRPESFDPRVDSLVRVQATRLRGLLNAY